MLLRSGESKTDHFPIEAVDGKKSRESEIKDLAWWFSWDIGPQILSQGAHMSVSTATEVYRDNTTQM